MRHWNMQLKKQNVRLKEFLMKKSWQSMNIQILSWQI